MTHIRPPEATESNIENSMESFSAAKAALMENVVRIMGHKPENSHGFQAAQLLELDIASRRGQRNIRPIDATTLRETGGRLIFSYHKNMEGALFMQFADADSASDTIHEAMIRWAGSNEIALDGTDGQKLLVNGSLDGSNKINEIDGQKVLGNDDEKFEVVSHVQYPTDEEYSRAREYEESFDGKLDALRLHFKAAVIRVQGIFDDKDLVDRRVTMMRTNNFFATHPQPKNTVSSVDSAAVIERLATLTLGLELATAKLEEQWQQAKKMSTGIVH